MNLKSSLEYVFIETNKHFNHRYIVYVLVLNYFSCMKATSYIFIVIAQLFWLPSLASFIINFTPQHITIQYKSNFQKMFVCLLSSDLFYTSWKL